MIMRAPVRQRYGWRGWRRPTLPGRGGLPVALAALAVIAAASTSASASRTNDPSAGPPRAAGITLPPVVPPTPSYAPGTSTFPTTGGTGPGSPAGSVPGSALATERASAAAADGLTASGLPTVAVQAYQTAAAAAGCGLSWTLLAAIGRVESNHGRFAGATLLADGRSDPPIVGIPLDGRPGVATIRDSDGGRYDGDTVYDRAVGPMQFIPGTWALFATDGDGDGTADPFNLNDAAGAAATYLCQAGGDLSTEAGQRDAVFSYNRSDSYVQLVLELSGQYAGGMPVDDLPAPDRTPRPLPPVATPTLPPVAIGDPPAVTTPRPSARPTTPKPAPPRPTTPSPTTPTTPRPTTPAPTSGPTTPSPTTSPTPAPTTPAPTCTPAPTATGTPTPSASGTPTGTPTPTPTPTPTLTPTLTPSPSGSPTGTPTPTPTPTPTTCPTP
jgi:hypothetical protein